MIKEFDTVLINNRPAIVKHVQKPNESLHQKAIIVQEGQEYSVNLSDLKPQEEKTNGGH